MSNFIELYPSSSDLIREHFSTIFESKHLQAKEFIPNIDQSTLAIDTSVENTLHSYFMLFCRRCHRYDCFLHKDKQVQPDLVHRSKISNNNYQSCSRFCYRTTLFNCKRTKFEFNRSQSDLSDVHRRSNGFHYETKRVKSEPMPMTNGNGHLKASVKRKLTEELSEWSASDKSLFRVFSLIYGDNICMIADLLDKPCSQVYLLSLNENHAETKTNEQHFLQRQCSTASLSTNDSFSAMTSTDSDGQPKANSTHEKDDSNSVEINSHLYLFLCFFLCFFRVQQIVLHLDVISIQQITANVTHSIHVITIILKSVIAIATVFVRVISVRNSVVVRHENVTIGLLAVVVVRLVRQNNVRVMQLAVNVILICVLRVVPMISEELIMK